jgi:hypothetical protein
VAEVDATAPGTLSHGAQTVTLVDEAGDDFHLAGTDLGAIRRGKADPGSGLFSDDIDGTTRTGTGRTAWDVGASQYTAGYRLNYKTNVLGATNSTTSFSLTLPVTEAGDLMILEFAHRNTTDGTIAGTSVTTDGLTWTLKKSQTFATSAYSGKTYYCRATGNHSTKTVTGADLTDSCAAILTIYRGDMVAGDALVDATIVGEENASGNETQAGITTATAYAWVVLVVVNSPDYNVSSQATATAPTLVERSERLSTGGTDTSVSHASGCMVTAGATGAFTWAQTNSASGSWAYAIKPYVAAALSYIPHMMRQYRARRS